MDWLANALGMIRSWYDQNVNQPLTGMRDQLFGWMPENPLRQKQQIPNDMTQGYTQPPPVDLGTQQSGYNYINQPQIMTLPDLRAQGMRQAWLQRYGLR